MIHRFLQAYPCILFPGCPNPLKGLLLSLQGIHYAYRPRFHGLLEGIIYGPRSTYEHPSALRTTVIDHHWMELALMLLIQSRTGRNNCPSAMASKIRKRPYFFYITMHLTPLYPPPERLVLVRSGSTGSGWFHRAANAGSSLEIRSRDSWGSLLSCS